MTAPTSLVVEQGSDAGRTVAVTSEGVRIGRTSKNDIVLNDPLVSRFHCRLFLKPDGALWVADLGSANQTLVNGNPVQDARLAPGDRVTVGNTIFRVLGGAQGETPVATATAVAAEVPHAVDLGLSSQRRQEAAAPTAARRPLVILGVGLAGLALAVLVLTVVPFKPRRKAPPPPPPPPPTLAVTYEKVTASTQSVFRYYLNIAEDNTISVTADDTDKLHLRKSGKIKGEQAQELTGFILDSGFMALNDRYAGHLPDVLEQGIITVTVGRRTHTVCVANQVEPPAFKKVRENIEDFAKNELSVRVLQYPPEELVKMARDAFTLGRKLYEERQVAYGNLSQAIKSLTDAENCLETVDPKPDFYADLLSTAADCREALEKAYNTQSFAAERAMKLKAWDDAARELRVLREIVPDRGDPRNQEATKKLIEVENRLKSRR